MDSTKDQFNNLAESFVKSFTKEENEIYKLKVVNKYTPEDFKLICDYIKEDKTQRRFPMPIDFERAALVVILPKVKREEYPSVAPEQVEAFRRFFRDECLKPILEGLTDKDDKQINRNFKRN